MTPVIIVGVIIAALWLGTWVLQAALYAIVIVVGVLTWLGAFIGAAFFGVGRPTPEDAKKLRAETERSARLQAYIDSWPPGDRAPMQQPRRTPRRR